MGAYVCPVCGVVLEDCGFSVVVGVDFYSVVCVLGFVSYVYDGVVVVAVYGGVVFVFFLV